MEDEMVLVGCNNMVRNQCFICFNKNTYTFKERRLEELERKYWFRNPQSFGQAMKSVGVGAITFMVMYEWRVKRNDKRLCFEQLSFDDKLEFMKDVMEKTKEIGIFKHKKRMPDFEIKDSIEYMGFNMRDYV